MELRRFTDVDDFLEVATPFLIRREAEHNLIFGVSANLREDPAQYTAPAYLATVADGDRVVAAALQTPPFRLTLSEVNDDAAIALIAADTLDRVLPGVQGPVEMVRAFVEERRALGGPPAHHEASERVYRLTKVIPPRPVPGFARPPVAADRDVIAEWVYAFHVEALGDDDRADAEASADRWMAGRGRRLNVWEDDGSIVSLVGVTGPTPNGIRVGPVYTPPESRGRGYASALTAAVSKAQLDAGRRFVFLFTDLANPTSNHIYQAIGYEPVSDIEVWEYERR
jgi:predicted GNAT family acetyltransferase